MDCVPLAALTMSSTLSMSLAEGQAAAWELTEGAKLVGGSGTITGRSGVDTINCLCGSQLTPWKFMGILSGAQASCSRHPPGQGALAG